MAKTTSGFNPQTINHKQTNQHHRLYSIPVIPLGMILSGFLSITYVLCVLFDLWFPTFAMNSTWSALLPGFIWISWSSFFLGLIETFAYGWYAALLYSSLHNFFARRKEDSRQM